MRPDAAGRYLTRKLCLGVRNHHWRRRASPRRVVAGCLLGLALGAGADGHEELARLRGEMASLREKLARHDETLGEARERAFALAREIDELAAARAALETRIAARREHVATLDAERAGLADALARSRRALGRNLVQRYALSTQPRLKLLLNQPDTARLARHLAFHDYASRAWARDFEALAKQVAALERTTAAFELETAKLRRLRQRHDTQLASLENMRSEHEALAAAIAARMRDDTLRLEQVAADERRLLELVEELAAATAASPERDFAALKGRLAWPADGRLASRPGTRLRDAGARWAGVLIASMPGTAVQAVAGGQVVYADWFRNLGKLVIIDHGAGYMTLYGNLAELATRDGAVVAAGDTIARVGAASAEMPAGLYFELRAGGRPLDPRTWCAKR